MITAAAAIAPIVPGQPAKGAPSAGGDMFALSFQAIADGIAPPPADAIRQPVAAPGIALPTTRVDPAPSWLPVVNVAASASEDVSSTGAAAPMAVVVQQDARAGFDHDMIAAVTGRSFAAPSSSAVQPDSPSVERSTNIPSAATPARPTSIEGAGRDIPTLSAGIAPQRDTHNDIAALSPAIATASPSHSPHAPGTSGDPVAVGIAIPTEPSTGPKKVVQASVSPAAKPEGPTGATTPVPIAVVASIAPHPSIATAQTMPVGEHSLRPDNDNPAGTIEPDTATLPPHAASRAAGAPDGVAVAPPVVAKAATSTTHAPEAVPADMASVIPALRRQTVAAGMESAQMSVDLPSADDANIEIIAITTPVMPLIAVEVASPVDEAPTSAAENTSVSTSRPAVATASDHVSVIDPFDDREPDGIAADQEEPAATTDAPVIPTVTPDPAAIGIVPPLVVPSATAPAPPSSDAKPTPATTVDAPATTVDAPVSTRRRGTADPATAPRSEMAPGVPVPAMASSRSTTTVPQPAIAASATEAVPPPLRSRADDMMRPDASDSLPIARNTGVARVQADIPARANAAVAANPDVTPAPTDALPMARRPGTTPARTGGSVTSDAPLATNIDISPTSTNALPPTPTTATTSSPAGHVREVRPAAPPQAHATSIAPTGTTPPLAAQPVVDPLIAVAAPVSVADAPDVPTTATPADADAAMTRPTFVREVTGGVRQTVALRPQAEAPAQPAAGTTAPASQVFGAAMHAANGPDERKRATPLDPASAVAAMAPVQTSIVAPVGESSQPTLDMRQDSWPSGMIDHIEALRDAANASDTRIRLVPDALGTINIAVRRVGDAIHVRFAAEDATTRTMIEDAQPRLAEIAQERGLKIGQSIVEPAPVTSTNTGQSGSGQQPSNQQSAGQSPTGNGQQQQSGQTQTQAQAGQQQQPRQQQPQAAPTTRQPAPARTNSPDTDAAGNGRIA